MQSRLYNLFQLEPIETRSDPVFTDFLDRYQLYIEYRQQYDSLFDWKRPEENDILKYLERKPNETETYIPKIEAIREERANKIEEFTKNHFYPAIDKLLACEYIKNRKVDKVGLEYELKFKKK